jgi:WhiB family transcriptional regulator, redox-sensing transcriptional regulator
MACMTGETTQVPDMMPGPEQYGPAQDRAVDVLMNNPAQALFYLFTALEPTVNHAPARLNHRLNMAQGPEPGWRIGPDHNMADAYGVKTLAAAGLWDQTTISRPDGQEIRAFRASPEDLDYRIGVATAALDWEIQFPDRTLAPYLGETRLWADQPMPSVSLSIYGALLASPNGTGSLTGLTDKTGLPFRTVERALRRLNKVGSIEKLSKHNFSHRRIALTDPDELMIVRRPGGGNTGPTKFIYETVARLCREEQTVMSGDALLRAVMSDHPGLDKGKVRGMMTGRPPKCITFVDDDIFGGEKTSFQIVPALRAGIADLVLRISTLRRDPGFVEAAGTRAREILKNSKDVALLMAKARCGALGETLNPSEYAEDPETAVRRRLGSLTLRHIPIEQKWQHRAACRNRDQEQFFPVSTVGLSAAAAEKAKALCRRCPVVGSCLQWSLDNGVDNGIFGGKDDKERRAYHLKPQVPELQRAA